MASRLPAGEQYGAFQFTGITDRMRRRSNPTIIDVAEAAGVSKSLVSLAIRGDAGVSEGTRARILQVADELGYRSNRWASSLVRGRSQLVGVLLTDLRNAYHTDVVVGVEDAATDLGLEVIVSHGRRDPDLLTERLESLLRLGVDGIVVVSAHTPPEVLAKAAAQTPTVVVGRPRTLPEGVSQVSNHDELGARLAVEHLVGLGHRRIAYLQASDSPAAVARRTSYEEALQAHGLGSQVLRMGELPRLADRGPGAPTAVFASNDRGAALVLGEAHDLGLSIPGDLAVMGYDDTELARLVRPMLTSVAQPRLTLGRRAMEIIQADEVVREVHPPELVVRASTFPG